MSDDIVERLRAEVAVCPGRGNSGHGLQHCAECCFGTGIVAHDADEERIMLLARDAADEIERLQALIDAYAVAWHKGGWAGDTPVLMAASDALLAAATKEDDRG